MTTTEINRFKTFMSSLIPENGGRIRNRTHALTVAALAAIANASPELALQFGVTYLVGAFFWNRGAQDARPIPAAAALPAPAAAALPAEEGEVLLQHHPVDIDPAELDSEVQAALLSYFNNSR